MRHHNRLRAFTLVEIMLVCVIIMILLAIAGPKMIGQGTKARIAATRAEMEVLKSAVNQFETHASRFPTMQEGFEALITKPADLPEEQWAGRYLDRPAIPEDAFQTPFHYIIPTDTGYEFEVVSAGPDRKFDTADDLRLSDGWRKRNTNA